ncbi:flavin reductase family protein [Neotabrizicola shimadae]|uniref:Flavin reductase family protein n=1 Tax=Neotabrizicola shimadae TaxID=2807096 RepID=A0A8G1EDF1_9RHOB|nr:flavin reductase family protein [Neotabrizicola shimadae]QYZ69344.1 flavin reductase family protein [Neotabrizicola shimadae]
MRYDLSAVPEPIAYKLLAATVIPRPIAWVVTQDAEGRLNAAPFSFFNVMGSAPPTVALGILADPARGLKDTAQAILDTGEFVVNLVPERLVQAMNLTSIDAPRGVNELELAGLATLPSDSVAPPRIAESPVAFECRLHTSVETGPNQVVVIGQVTTVHIEDRFLLDPVRAHVDTDALDLVARSFGAGYIRSHDTFQLARPTWANRSR